MHKEILLIKQVFNLNYGPLTCNVMYVDFHDSFYLFVNEESIVIYNPESFTPVEVFIKDKEKIKIDTDNWYEPFDNYIPHISKKIIIEIKRKSPDKTIVVKERPPKYTTNETTIFSSGCTTIPYFNFVE